MALQLVIVYLERVQNPSDARWTRRITSHTVAIIDVHEGR